MEGAPVSSCCSSAKWRDRDSGEIPSPIQCLSSPPCIVTLTIPLHRHSYTVTPAILFATHTIHFKKMFSFVNLFSVLCTLCTTLFAISRLFRLGRGPQLLVMVPPAQQCPIIIVTDAEGGSGTRCEGKSPLLNNPQLCNNAPKNSIRQQLSHWQASRAQEWR